MEATLSKEVASFVIPMVTSNNIIAMGPLFGGQNNGGTVHFFDPATGEAHAICYEPTNPNAVWHTVLDKNGQVTREEPIPVQDGPSVHDCQNKKLCVSI